jgi:DNA-binding NtrC family response regulator
MQYSWPGNVRELENACERVAQTCTCDTIRVDCVASSVRLRDGVDPPAIAAPLIVPQESAPMGLDVRLRQFEISLIREALLSSGGNKSRAAELLQIKRSTLADRIHRCGLNEPNAGEEASLSAPVAARHERSHRSIRARGRIRADGDGMSAATFAAAT